MSSLVEKCDELKFLCSGPYPLPSRDLSRKFRELFPSSLDFAKSELSIAEYVSETPWFWNTAIKLACDYPQDWLSDVVKAILIHADLEGLAEIADVPELKTFKWPRAITGIVEVVRLRQRGEYAKVATALKEFAIKETYSASVFTDEYMDALENIQSAELVKWISANMPSNYKYFAERWRRVYEDLQMLSKKDYYRSLLTVVPKLNHSDPSSAVLLWEELNRVDPIDTANQIAYYKEHSTNPLFSEKGLVGLEIFNNSSVEVPANTPEVLAARKIADWALSEESNVHLEKIKFSKNNVLYGEPCRLAQLRILSDVFENVNIERAAYLARLETVDSNWCPLHQTRSVDAWNFVHPLLVNNADELTFTRRAITKFMELATKSKRFELDSKSEAFLTRNNSEPLLEWQEHALQSWAAHGRNGIIAAATGTGKSRLGVAAMLENLSEGKATVFLSHRLAIKGQWKKDELFATGERDVKGKSVPESERIFFLERNVLELSSEDIYSKDDPPRAERGKVLLALDRSLSTRPQCMPSENSEALIVADEVHRFGADAGQIVLSGEFSKRMGLSATITEKDTSVLNQFGKTLVAEYPIKRAMEDKVISEFNLLVIRAPIVMKKYIFGAEDHTLDVSTKIEYEYTSYDLKKAEEELEKALLPLKDIELDESEEFEPALLRLIRNRDIKFAKLARKYLQAKRQYDRVARSGKFEESILDILAPKIYQYGKTLVFSNSRAQGKSFADELDSRKVTYIDGDTEQLGRKNAFTDLQEGQISAVIAPMILDEGVNIPNAKIGIFLGPGREGYRQVIQRMGRVLRKKNEGERALLILVAGINTREDPGINGEKDWIRDSTYAVMSEHAHEIRIVDFTDPTTIYEELDSLIELD